VSAAVEFVRWYNVAAAVAVIVTGTAQARRWRTFDAETRLHWQSTALLNLTALFGTWESLRDGYPGGGRVYLLAVGLTWLLAAVAYRPFVRWRTRHRTPPEAP